jgi:hypothetical protein
LVALLVGWNDLGFAVRDAHSYQGSKVKIVLMLMVGALSIFGTVELRRSLMDLIGSQSVYLSATYLTACLIGSLAMNLSSQLYDKYQFAMPKQSESKIDSGNLLQNKLNSKFT